MQTIQTLKICLYGPPSVGKSHIQAVMHGREFSEIYSVGTDFIFKNIEINNTTKRLMILDTQGVERFPQHHRSYLRAPTGIIYVFDLSDRSTFESFNQFLISLQDITKAYCFVLVGNKKDLVENRQVEYKEAHSLAKQFGGNYYEVSAINRENMDHILVDITKKLLMMKPDVINARFGK